jgi:hypothetical protein
MADKKKSEPEVEAIVSEPSETEKQLSGIPAPDGPGIDERMADLQKDLVAMGAREA